MKRTFIIFCCFIAICPVFSQIPNGTFEKWVQKEYSLVKYEDPDSGWITLNENSVPKGYMTVSKTEDTYPYGDYAVKLQSFITSDDTLGAILYTQILTSSTFLVNTKPGSLCGYYKFLPENNDSFSIYVKMYQGGNLVGHGSFTSGDKQMKYAPFSVDIKYVSFTAIPNSVSIWITPFARDDSDAGKPKGSSVLYIDNISFDSLTIRDVTQPEELDISKIVSVSPNPFSDHIEISVSKKASQMVYAKMITADGRVIINQPVKNRQLSINTANIPSGNYCLELTYGNDLKTYDLVKKTK